MKKAAIAAVVLLLAAALYFFLRPGHLSPPAIVSSPTSITPAPAVSNSSGSAPAQHPSSAVPLAPEAGQLVEDSAPPPNLTPQTLIQNLGRSIHQYGQMFDGNPVGTNPEITAQLSGNNPKHVNFVTAQTGMRINGNGELVDAWGTPFFFHQISGSEMEIHSAGPDKVMWTSDDLVVK